MLIENTIKSPVFEDLKGGDSFVCGNTLWIKSIGSFQKDNVVYNCFNPLTGGSGYFTNSNPVSCINQHKITNI